MDSTERTRLSEQVGRHLWVHSFPHEIVGAPGIGLLTLTRGEGVYVWDVEGKRYFDAYSGLSVVGVGHGRTEIAEAAAAQMKQLAFVSPVGCTTPVTVELASKLASIAPGDLNRVFFSNSGSEAVEMALAIAKQYHYNRGERDRKKVICRIGSYHGQTAGAETVTRHSIRPPREPLGIGAIPVQGVDCYLCPYEKTYPDCNVYCARSIEAYIHAEHPEMIAAIIAEPISTANGGYVPPVEYWQTLRKLCDRFGILLIADEVLNGLGRTGKWFGIEHFGVVPDIIATSKHLTCGYAPISATIVRDKVYDAFTKGIDSLFAVGSTFGGHPVSCAAALANLAIIEREGLVENAARMGEYLMAKLKPLVETNPIVGDVRGIGLMTSIQFVKDKRTRTPFTFAEARMLGVRIHGILRQMGILVPHSFGALALHPPLCVTREQIDEMVAGVETALRMVAG